MSAEAAGTPVEVGAFTVVSSDPPAEARASIEAASEPEVQTDDEKGDPVSKAASELGKLGGKAAAKARAVREKAEPAKEAKAEPAAEDEGEEAEGDEKPLGKPRDDPRARIRELAEKRKAAEARAQAAEERAARLEREREEERRRPAQPPPEREQPRAAAPQGKPRPDDFGEYEDYLDARDKWNREEWQREANERNQAEQRTHKIRNMAATFQGEVQKYRATDPDFDTRVSQDILDLKPSFVAIQYRERPDARHFIADELVQDPENAPRLMVYLSQHKNEFQRIATLQSPREVTRALAMVVARLDAATSATSSKAEVSKAPAPVRSVTGAPPAASGDVYREGMDFDEYYARRSKTSAR